MLDIMQTVLVPVRVHQFLILSDPLFLLELVPGLLGLEVIEVIGDAESSCDDSHGWKIQFSDPPYFEAGVGGSLEEWPWGVWGRCSKGGHCGVSCLRWFADGSSCCSCD